MATLPRSWRARTHGTSADRTGPSVSETRRGFWFGFGAYFLWGIFPLYFPLLEPTGSVEVLAQRILWSLVFVGALLLIGRGWSRVRAIVAEPRRLRLVAVGSVLIAINWGVFIWSVLNGHVLETSLGYFINPLVLIFLGVALMGERLRRIQWLAIALAAIAVVQLTVDYGRPPWIALTLAFSFGTYGLMKKKAGVGAVEGLTLETLILAPLALGYIVWAESGGTAVFGHEGVPNMLLLAGAGVITAVPLLLFGGAATRIPMTTLGLLQYIAPTMHFMLGIAVFHESMTTGRWIGFVLVWLALAILTAESVLTRRRAVPRTAEVQPAIS
jgi:chloramphenicol-sensitive protein RarD